MKIWVVGGSSGIGAALVEQLVSRGDQVVVSARRVELLAQLPAHPLGLDVTDHEAVVAGYAEVLAHFGVPDQVIWSVGYWQQFEMFDQKSFNDHVNVNITGLGNLISVLTPQMLAGKIQFVGISSVVTSRGFPGAEAYGSCKAFQSYLFETLRARGLNVVTVSPGFVDTEMTQQNKFKMPFLMTPEEAATEILAGLAAGKSEISFPWQLVTGLRFARILPDKLWQKLMKNSG